VNHRYPPILNSKRYWNPSMSLAIDANNKIFRQQGEIVLFEFRSFLNS